MFPRSLQPNTKPQSRVCPFAKPPFCLLFRFQATHELPEEGNGRSKEATHSPSCRVIGQQRPTGPICLCLGSLCSCLPAFLSCSGSMFVNERRGLASLDMGGSRSSVMPCQPIRPYATKTRQNRRRHHRFPSCTGYERPRRCRAFPT